MPTSSSTSSFAEDPGAHLHAAEGARVVDDPRFHLTVAADGTSAGVCRLRLAEDEVDAAFAEIVALVPASRVEWVLGPSATPAGLEERLRALGCRDQDPPLSTRIAALATEQEPPAVDGVTIAAIETFDAFLVGLEVMIAGWGFDDARAARMREQAQAAWRRHGARPGGHWLASIDGEPVAYAGAIAGPAGLFLSGGVTVPHARGRGAYRALVRARWDDAVRRGTPALVVHAEEASRRVLAGIGFTRVCEIVELVSEPA